MFLIDIFKSIFNKQKNSYSGEAIIFPAYDELSYEQKEAVNLPFDRTNVVLGAPGTGKTIVAIHRIHRLYEVTSKKIKMLVYNRALYNYIVEVQKQLGFENEFEVSTVNDFVYYDLYNGVKEGKAKNIIDKDVPHIGDNKYNTDWKQVLLDVSEINNIYEHIVIDEGQDFNEYFYQVIKKLSNHITLFADPNQAIQYDSAPLSKILEILGKEAYFVLTLNYRNSKNIVNFTRRYCYDKSIFAESYKEKDDLKIIQFDENDYIEIVAGIIKNYSSNTNIGIIVPHIKNLNGETDRKYEKGLYYGLKKKLKRKYKVQMYYNDKVKKDRELLSIKNTNFAENSIKIFNYSTIRGLDFDIVILLDFISEVVEKEVDDAKKIEIIKDMNKVYIASTRAKEKLYVLRPNANGAMMFVDNGITYAYFDNISDISLGECLNNARNAEEKEMLVLALYYYHYAIAVLGIEDKETLKRTLCAFANICINFNKADFALGSIFNYSYKYNDVDDQNLIFFYQSALIHSYNGDFIYNNVDRFFNRISKLTSEDDRDDLISEFYNEYFSRCYEKNMAPDINYTKELVEKYNYQDYAAYKEFLSNCREYAEEEENHDGDDENDSDKDNKLLKEKIAKLTPHELLDNSYITVVGASNTKKIDFERKAESKGFESGDFDFNLDYETFTNKSFDYIKKDCDKPVAIIYGATPHSMRGKGDFSSMLIKWKQPGYPRVFEAKHGKSLSLGTFKLKLDEIIGYLRERLYRRNKVKTM